MATVALTASPTQLDAGTTYDLVVVNSGSSTVHVQVDSGNNFDQRLSPGQSVVVYPHGLAVTAYARSGSGQVTVTTQTNPQSPSGGSSVASTLVDAKGDLIGASANDTPARVPVGADGTALLADSSQAVGVRWGTISGTATVGSVADVAALQGLTGGVPQQVRSLGRTYVYNGSSTATENGTSVIKPTAVASGSAGRWVRTSPATDNVARIGDVLQEAKSRVVRVLITGTSIETFDTSCVNVFGEHLRSVYGDAKETLQFGSILGGNFSSAVNGWEKQVYSGLGLVRLRGNTTTSTTVQFMTGYGDELTINYSTESDGGSFPVYDNGVQVATINCSGSQNLNNSTTINLSTLGQHSITFGAPTGGYAYVNFARIARQGRVGIEVINASLGGTLFLNMFIPPTPAGSQVAAVATVGNNGVDAYFNRTDVDIVIDAYTVNDAGYNTANLANFTTYVKPGRDRAVAQTLANNINYVLLIEPGGHLAMPSDAGYLQFQAIREDMLQKGRDNTHVTALDWHAETIIDSNYPLYASRYYTTGATVTFNGDGTYNTGDFIHPNSRGMEPGTALLCKAAGVSVPARQLASTSSTDRNYGTAVKRNVSPLALPVADSVTRSYPAPAGYALQAFTDNSFVPYYHDESVIDYAVLTPAISGGSRTDSTGNYLLPADLTNLQAPGVATSERVTTTVIYSGALSVRSESTTKMYVGGVQALTVASDANRTTLALDSGSSLAAVTFDTDSGYSFTVSGTAKIYAWVTTKSAGTAIITSRKYATAFQGIGAEQRISSNPAYNPDYLGQGYFEDLSGTLVRGKLVSYATAWDFTAQAAASGLVGVYECTDRTAAGYVLGRQLSGSQASSPLAAGGGESASSNPGIITSASNFTISVGGKATALVRTTSQAASMRICFQNGGTFRFLTPAGLWQSGSTALWTGPPVGRNLAFTFDLPTGADLTALGNTPSFRVELAGATSATVVPSATCVRGQRPMV